MLVVNLIIDSVTEFSRYSYVQTPSSNIIAKLFINLGRVYIHISRDMQTRYVHPHTNLQSMPQFFSVWCLFSNPKKVQHYTFHMARTLNSPSLRSIQPLTKSQFIGLRFSCERQTNNFDRGGPPRCWRHPSHQIMPSNLCRRDIELGKII